MPDSAPSLHHRLRRLKAALLAVSFTLAGILLMMVNTWLAPLQLGDWQWLHALPLGELGGTLFGAGLLSTFFEYTFRRDQERAVTERFRQTIREEAPALRDAVIEAFRFDRQDVARIATPELLDDLARTMSLNVDKVWVVVNGQELLLPINEVKTGSEIVVRTGNMIPLDGKLSAGEAMVNQASMTGESMPVRKTVGGMVYAGTVVEEG